MKGSNQNCDLHTVISWNVVSERIASTDVISQEDDPCVSRKRRHVIKYSESEVLVWGPECNFLHDFLKKCKLKITCQEEHEVGKEREKNWTRLCALEHEHQVYIHISLKQWVGQLCPVSTSHWLWDPSIRRASLSCPGGSCLLMAGVGRKVNL